MNETHLNAMVHLKVARASLMSAARLADDDLTRAVHLKVWDSIAANDDAQTLLADILGTEFKSSIPTRCRHVEKVADMPTGTDPRCWKEAGHEGPHMFGPFDPEEPLPSA